MVPFDVSSTITGPAPGDFSCDWAPSGAIASNATAQAASIFTIDDPPSADASRATHFRDPDLRTDIRQHAFGTQRIHRPAHVLAPGDEIEVDDRPPAAMGRFVQRVLSLFGRARAHPSQPIRDSMDV